MGMRGSECFNLTYYQISNADMPIQDATWQHFINQGQFEGRPFRYSSVIRASKMSTVGIIDTLFVSTCKLAQWYISNSCVYSNIKHFDVQG